MTFALLYNDQSLTYPLLNFSSGTIVASFCYLQFFPPPYDVDGNACFPKDYSYIHVPLICEKIEALTGYEN